MVEQRKPYATRRELLLALSAGEVPCDEAAGIAMQNDWAPLWKVMPKDRFDPFLDPRWTLQMTVAWMIWRTREMVTEFDEAYRANNQCAIFVEVDGKRRLDRIEPFPKPSLVEMYGDSQKEAKRYGNLLEALQAIIMQCRAGKLTVWGFDNNKGQRVSIPPYHWDHIEFCLGGFGNPAGDCAEYKERFASVNYTALAFDVTEVKGTWPELPAAKSPTATINQETECEAWLKTMMVESPTIKTMTKRAAMAEWRKGHRISGHGFERAWSSAVKATGAAAWSASGAPKKIAAANRNGKIIATAIKQ